MPQVDPSATFTQERKKAQAAQPIIKFEFDLNDDGTYEIEEKFVLNAGSISRSIQWDTQKFSPGGNTIEIDNTNGSWSDFLSGSNTNGVRYHGKKMRVSIGFKLIDGSEEYLPQYVGIINEKSENVNGRTVSIKTFDIFQKILSYKIANKIDGSDAFEYESSLSDDIREIQTVVAMGEHKFPSEQLKETQNRSDPFNLIVCIMSDKPSNTGGTGRSKPVGVADSYYEDYEKWWIAPIVNELDTGSDTADVYYWDYSADPKEWKKLTGSSQRSIVDTNGYRYIRFTSDTQTDEDASTFNWSDYINGTGAFSGSADDLDPAVAIQCSTDNSVTVGGKTIPNLNNPACQIYYMLVSSRFLNLDETTDTGDIDQKNFSSPDNNYTFDKAYSYLNSNSVKCFTNFKSQISMLEAIEKISEIVNIAFYSTQPLSNTNDRSIKLQMDIPVVDLATCDVIAPISDTLTPGLNIHSMMINSNLTLVNNRITMKSMDYTKDLVSNPTLSIIEDIQSTTEYGQRNTEIQSNLKNGVSLYNSTTFAASVVSFRLGRVSEPEITVNIQTDFYAMHLFIKNDTVKIVDSSSGLDDTFQIKSRSINFNNGTMQLTLSKFGRLFGPDPDDPTKKWAFVGCAYIDADADGNTYHVY